MFRDIVYITHDFSFRVQDGWMIFRWWRAYVPKDVSEGKMAFLFKESSHFIYDGVQAKAALTHRPARSQSATNDSEQILKLIAQ